MVAVALDSVTNAQTLTITLADMSDGILRVTASFPSVRATVVEPFDPQARSRLESDAPQEINKAWI
jgi:hypothetical protein